IDQYQRGALAELLGFVWMPLIMLFIEQLFDRPRSPSPFANASPEQPIEVKTAVPVVRLDPRRSVVRGATAVAGLALAYGAFLWSHPPTPFHSSLVLPSSTPPP